MIGTVLILRSSLARKRWLRRAAAACCGLALPMSMMATRIAEGMAAFCVLVGMALAILARNGGPCGPVLLTGARPRRIGPGRIVLRCDAGTVAVWRDAVGDATFRRLAAAARWNPAQWNSVRGN